MTKRLVLIGGGHSHGLVLKYWGRRPLPGVALTLISDGRYTPYSGLLPGHVAGFYTYEESHIDLVPLAAYAGAMFLQDRVIALDLDRSCVVCQERGEIPFDYLSLDIGSTPAIANIAGAAYGIAAKPVANFLQQWQALLDHLQGRSPKALTVAIVGGGAGGVELAFNVQARLRRQFPALALTVQLWQRGDRLLPNQSDCAAHKITQLCAERHIQIWLGQTVIALEPDDLCLEFPRYRLHTASGLEQPVNVVFWVTQASAPDWLQTAGLQTDDQGFVLVDACLRSLSHPHIFAAGDIASLSPHPCPKAGVFAVRQGRPLFDNLRRALGGQSLHPWVLPQRYLSLIGTGDQTAIALWGKGGSYGHWEWRLKDWIDRRFMQRLSPPF